MIIDVDLTSVPPVVSLRDPDDFASFRIVARGGHAYIDRTVLLALVGARSDDPDWVEHTDAMLAFAASKGWVNDAGATRAHVEFLEPGQSASG
jgi:hypothetical protein